MESPFRASAVAAVPLDCEFLCGMAHMPRNRSVRAF